jgi:hypothetical protein
MTSDMWWIGPTVIVLIRLLYAEAMSAKALVSGEVLIFRVAIAGRLLALFAITALFILLIRSIGHEELWVLAGGAGLLILLCLTWPSTITIDSFGVTRHLWWKPKRTIRWAEKKTRQGTYVYTDRAGKLLPSVVFMRTLGGLNKKY